MSVYVFHFIFRKIKHDFNSAGFVVAGVLNDMQLLSEYMLLLHTW